MTYSKDGKILNSDGSLISFCFSVLLVVAVTLDAVTFVGRAFTTEVITYHKTIKDLFLVFEKIEIEKKATLKLSLSAQQTMAWGRNITLFFHKN